MQILQKISIFFALALGLANLAQAEQDAPRIDHLLGKAFDIKSGELLYEEHHSFEYTDDRITGSKVVYLNPEGEEIARKSLDYSRDPSLPAFKTEQYGGRFIEGLEYTDDGKLRLFHKKDGEELQSKVIDPRKNMTADAGFNNHVHKHYDDLIAGETVKFHITVPNRLMSLKFKAERVNERQLEGLNLVDFEISLDSLFGLFIDPLTVSYDTQSKMLIEYVGLTNIRDEEGEMYEARIIYPELLKQATAALQ